MGKWYSGAPKLVASEAGASTVGIAEVAVAGLRLIRRNADEKMDAASAQTE